MFSRELYDELDLVVEDYPRLPLLDPYYYGKMLLLQEQVMRASEPLIKLNRFAHPYFDKHADEEVGHHAWIVRDLANLGLEPQEKVIPEVADMVGRQYYLIHHVNELHFFGYLAFLEGYPVAPEHVKLLEEHYPQSMKTITFHAKHDISHRQEICEQLDQLDHRVRAGVLANALASAQLYKAALWRIHLEM